MVGDLLLQTGPDRLRNVQFKTGLLPGEQLPLFSAVELLLAEGEAKLHYPCRKVDRACWHLTLCFMEGIKCECHCLD